jgi:lauroyl/myristoyl acyltransferase
MNNTPKQNSGYINFLPSDFASLHVISEKRKAARQKNLAWIATLTDMVVYWLGRGIIAFVQALPLTMVAYAGRAAGTLAYHLDGRHRRIAISNLVAIFGADKSLAEVKSIARENFKRIGENHLSAIKTASMSFEALRLHLEFTGLENFPQFYPEGKRSNAVVAIGHFGNFELYARVVEALNHDCVATTYRGFKQPALSRLLQFLREKSGCVFFERRTEGHALRAKLNDGGLILGLLADQNSTGMRAPFMDRECNTGLAPAVFALRYNAPLLTAICYRIGVAKWRIDCGPAIPTHTNGHARTSEELMRTVNHRFEDAVRRDPANWFWVHRRWKD